jgi:hypothetical protein
MSTLAERYWQELRPSAAAHRPEDELAGDGSTGRRRRRTAQPQLRRQRTRRGRGDPPGTPAPSRLESRPAGGAVTRPAPPAPTRPER